jgi:dihydroorotate dehydrogenase
MEKLLIKLLHLLPAETAHDLAIWALRNKIYTGKSITPPKHLAKTVAGITFLSPIGLAAGFDKNGDCIDALATFGFGFIEVGTATPKPQIGNPKPRLFRLKQYEAIINRFGFNNKGAAHFVANLQKPRIAIVGANIGKNKDTESHIDDYVYMLKQVEPYCDYITINISSPNTAGLRSIQDKNFFADFIAEIPVSAKPIFVKLAPDLTGQEIDDICSILLAAPHISGVIVSNTTVDKAATPEYIDVAGGLSGKVLMEKSTEVLKHFASHLKGKKAIIAAGGVSNAEDAKTKLAAGADLVQIYTAFIYQGFGLVEKIYKDL